MNGRIVEAVGAQLVEVSGRHAPLLVGQFGGILAQGPVRDREWRRPPIRDDGMHKLIGVFRILVLPSDLCTEVVRVSFRTRVSGDRPNMIAP